MAARINGAGVGSYMVRSGDTLRSIACASYGDEKLWWQIADANGLPGESGLRVGQTLTIPTVAGGASNNNFKPYDPSKITGDTTPGSIAVRSSEDVGLLVHARPQSGGRRGHVFHRGRAGRACLVLRRGRSPGLSGQPGRGP